MKGNYARSWPEGVTTKAARRSKILPKNREERTTLNDIFEINSGCERLVVYRTAKSVKGPTKLKGRHKGININRSSKRDVCWLYI